MNRPNPKFVGAFVVASLALLLGMIAFFGSSSLLSKNTRFILFFDQSVNGLNEGSLVKFRGVPVGTVQRVLIRAEGQHPDSTAIPVIINIDRTRLENDLGVVDETFDPESIRDSIRRGLVAELTIESFITGQLFIEFSFNRERSSGLQRHLIGESEMMEIPTLSSSLEEITEDIAKLISDFGSIDLERLNDNLNLLMENLTVVLAGIKSEELSDSVVSAATQIGDFLSSESFAGTVSSLKIALDEVSATASSLNMKEGPLADSIKVRTQEFGATLVNLNELMAKMSLLIEPDSSVRFEAENTLREVSRTAQSIRKLVDYLERNPKALLTGRAEAEE
ncbi:MAG: MlaD family protein [Verrucomicrobiota bacterium]